MKAFLKTLLGFTAYWNHKPTDAIDVDSSGVEDSDKFFNFGTSKNSFKM